MAYDGLCTFEYGIAVEVFGLKRPELEVEWYDFETAGVDEGDMRAAGGLQVHCIGGAERLEQAGTIVIPGWRGIDAAVPDHLIEALRAAYANGARLLSICSGVTVLAQAGLLDGKSATTHWRYAEAMAKRFPLIHIVPDVLYVEAGSILTSAGSAAGIDMCLHLVRKDYGAKIANLVAKRLVVPAHREGGQAQFIESAVHLPHEAPRLGPLLDEMRATLAHPHSIGSLAAQAGMSERTFLRRFQAATSMTPAKWLLHERLSRARALLEETNKSIEDIAAHCGFGGAPTLRHHFRQVCGTSPTAYRRQFQIRDLEEPA